MENNEEAVDEKEVDESLLSSVVSARTPTSEENSKHQELVKSLQEIFNQRDEEMLQLKNLNMSLNHKKSNLEKTVENLEVSDKGEQVQAVKLKRTILAINKIAEIKEAEVRRSMSSEDTVENIVAVVLRKKTESEKYETNNKCKCEDKGRQKDGKTCQFFHPGQFVSITVGLDYVLL